MVNVGLIGYGKWGKILYDKLMQLSDVKFVCRSEDDYESKLDDVDWVVVATPNQTHFNIVRNCMSAGKNVFCEKPLTLTEEKSKLLFGYAKMMGVKLYVDDIQNYREYDFEMMEHNLLERRKGGGGNIKDILYRLTYHDIYVLYEYIKNSEIEDIIVMDNKNKLHFNVKFNDIDIEFLYDLHSKDIEHNINGYNFRGEDDILTKMLLNVFSGTVDFEYNKRISLFTNRFIDLLNDILFKKVAVVGGGAFGCTTAWTLSKNGYDVKLFEKNDDIITQASYINQYRLHRGYHYPRSIETAKSSIVGERSFLKTYGDSIVNGEVEHYYCIAEDDSLVTSKEYIDFLDDVGLDYEHKSLDLIRKNVVNLTLKVNETLFDPNILRELLWNKLKHYGVDVNLNTKVDLDDLDNYDYIVNATYANTNHLLEPSKHKDYQFELCEKPVIKLPEQYKNKSIVIMDGPFMCIDPLGDTEYHVMGNVVHAIHSTNVGKFPVSELKFDELLNRGIIENPSITNIDKFIDSAKKFFVGIEQAEHVGSMFTFRTVLPNREDDDARPTLVEKQNDRLFTLFSGKIGTCVDAVEQIMEGI